VQTLGHKGLFLDRLDNETNAPSSSGDSAHRLVPFSHSIYHNRNRVYAPSLGRFLQQDPNQTAMMISAMLPMNGGQYSVSLDAVGIEELYEDGHSLYQYIKSNPIKYNDPTGLFVPDPSDFITGSLEALVEDYSANIDWDVEWANDWLVSDDDHSRTDNTWIYLALGRGLYDAFWLGIPGTDIGYNPLELAAGKKSSTKQKSAGSNRVRGGHNIHTQRGQDAHKKYRNALGSGYDIEVSVPGGRVDAIDVKNKIVRELKPDTPSGRARGLKQLTRYIKALKNHPNPDIRGDYTGFLDTYRK
jgi:hypothetical protein